MNYKRVGYLSKLFFLFFLRNILQVGILKKRSFRIILTGMFVLLATYLTVIMSFFFVDNNSSIKQTRIVLDIYVCMVTLFTFIVFLFMKILFMKKNVFISITMQLPVTKKEINTAILFYEMSITIMIVMGLCLSMSLAVIISNGIVLITRIICNIIFSSITVYFLLEFVYAVLNLLIELFKLEKIKNVLLMSFLSAIFCYLYCEMIPLAFEKILYGYTEGRTTSQLVFYSYLMEKYHFVIALIVFIVIVAILGSCIIPMQGYQIKRNNSYVHILKKNKKNMSIFKAYVYALIRNNETFSYYVISVCIYLILKMNRIENSIYSMAILTVNSIYAYVQTENIRFIILQKRYSLYRDYLYIIISQLTYMFVFSFPVVMIELITNYDIKGIFILYLTMIGMVIIFSMVGIVFPAKQENPFSAIIGSGLVIVVFLLVGIAYMHINNKFVLYGSICVSEAVAITVSFLGMKKILYQNRCENRKGI